MQDNEKLQLFYVFLFIKLISNLKLRLKNIKN